MLLVILSTVLKNCLEEKRYVMKLTENLSFQVRDGSYEGHSITLKKVLNGNLNTHNVNKSTFPTE